jgi:protein-S-isoprenylcysteine O-methyltransferase Ste14
VRRSRALAGSVVFFLIGPGLEAGLGPYLLATVTDAPAHWPAAVRVAGALLIAAGLAVLVSVFARFVTEGAGTPSPAAPTQRLIVGGAYRYVRNPMYVATAAVIVGEALAFAEPVLFAGAGAYCVALGLFGRFVEEPRLQRRFGGPYEAYRRAVPAWRPRLRPWDQSDGGN